MIWTDTIRFATYHEMLTVAIREGRADVAYALTIAIHRVVTEL